MVLRSYFGNFKSAYHILDNISSSVCATNWEKAKILHCKLTHLYHDSPADSQYKATAYSNSL